MFRKMIIVGMVFALLVATLPVTSVFAAPLGDDPNPGNGKDAYPRVERAFARVKEWYTKQGEFITKSGEFISKAESLIAKANEKGFDTSAVQSALDAFSNSIPALKSAHDRAGAIISAHNGFDGNGKVTDIKLAVQTVKNASAALQEGRQAHLGLGKALINAIRDFIKANRPHRSNEGSGSLPPVPNDQ
jgi:hypothetical protein